MLSVILTLLLPLASATVDAHLSKRSPPTDPAEYYVSAKKYEDSWHDKVNNPKKTFYQESKACKKYFMLLEKTGDEISAQAWAHDREVNELKDKINVLSKKKEAANYKFDAYKKLATANFAQRASNLKPTAQTALYEAWHDHGLTGSSARPFVKNFIEWGLPRQALVRTKILEQQASDPSRDRIVQQLQASYLTTREPKYYDLIKNDEKKEKLQAEWETTLDRNDKDQMVKHQRDFQKVNLRNGALEDMSWDAATELSKLYEDSYWRHITDLRRTVKRLKLMQAKQAKWTDAAVDAGAYSVPPSPYSRDDPEVPEPWEWEDEQVGPSEHYYE